MRKIILTGGGTAGHVTPILALLPYLHRTFDEIHFVGSENGIEKNLINAYDYVNYHAVPCIKFIRGLSSENLKIPFILHKGISKCKKLLKEIKPNIIFSKGGYVSLPICLAAKKIPIIIHESDFTMGLANKIIAKRAAAVCTAFPNTAEKYKNAYYTGLPLRGELFTSSKANLQINPELPTVLIMGGSQGAKKINDCVSDAYEMLLNRYNVIHITGKGNKLNIKSSSTKGVYLGLEYATNIHDYLNNADAVVSRGGAGSLFEVIALKKPSLIIPLPKGRSRGDQLLNAEYFEKSGCCYVLKQEDLSAVSLVENLNRLMNDNELLFRLRNKNNINGTQKVLEIIDCFSEENINEKN